MLLSLHVKNLALIEEAEVEFGPGLNILTGETGAGKSIIIGSLNLALGEKVSKEMLRENAQYALVELIFSVTNPSQIEQLQQMGVYPEDGQVIMSRKITQGRSVGRINSETVSASFMKEVAELLIDIHGQHEHQSLLHKKKHLEILDEYAKESLKMHKAKMMELFHEYQALKKELSQCVSDEQQRMREMSFLEYEINEIEEANPILGEDEQLEQSYRKMSHGKKILEAVGMAYNLTADGVSNAADQISRALREVGSVSSYDEQLRPLEDQLADLENLLNDFNRELASYMTEAEFSDEEFYRVQQRLDAINHLKAKYGDGIDLILKAKEEKEARYDSLKNYEQYLEQLNRKLKDVTAQLKEVCEKVTSVRKESAVQLEQSVTKSLLELNFLDVNFKIHFNLLEDYTANGMDDVEFLISTNPGEPVKPLGKVASGGELSRIMLALKTILAENDLVETMIFDEIDTGISGRTAQMVAEKMNIIGKNHQVICITHLPQIAAMSDRHFLIKKMVEHQSTLSTIRPLKEEESVVELARMLGGVKVTDTVLESAKEMRTLALAVK